MTDAEAPPTIDPPFGALAPSPAQERARALARRLPYTYLGRKLASALLGPAGGRSGRAFDVRVFGSERARLHPYDNICEKRVFLTPHHWDPAERALLAQAIAESPAGDFWFVDVGANVGLYTLFALSVARRVGKHINAVCVEPDPEMVRRLMVNIAASGATDQASIVAAAASDVDGPLRLAVNADSRGMSRVAPGGGVRVDGLSLATVLANADAPRVDAMKIDIEGGEHAALEALMSTAPHALRPRMILMETSHGDARGVALAAGYVVQFENDLNCVLALPRDA